MRKRVTTNEFIHRARKVHGERYDYSRAVWKSTHSAVTIICPRHGPFEQRAGNHLRGHGCRKCGRKPWVPARWLPVSEAEDKDRKLHPDYSLDRASYRGSTNAATWRCTLHGSVFRASAQSLACGQIIGCRACIAETERVSRCKARHDPNAKAHLAFVAARFDDRYREAYTLYLDGAPLREIGAAWGVTAERAWQWLDRIRRALDRFDRYGDRRPWRRRGKPPAPLRSLFDLDRG